MREDDRPGLLERIKTAVHRDGNGEDMDPIELERLSLTDTTDGDRVDAPAGTGGDAGNELAPDRRNSGAFPPNPEER